MKKISLLLIAVLIAFLLNNCSEDAESKESEKDETAAVPVEVGQVRTGNISAVFSGTANLEAEGEAIVVAKVAGVVKSILVEEGDLVKKGQILAKLDDEQPVFKLNQAKANLNKIKNETERNEKLYKENLISAEAFDKIKYEYESLKAAFDLARLEVNYTSIKAPIGGIISNRFIKEGNMININDHSFKITDFDPLNAILYVPERNINKLEKNQPVEFTVDAIPKYKFQGHVERISPVVDPNSGTVKVTIEIQDLENKLKPGMFGRANIVYNVHANTLLVPKEAIITEDKETSVYVIKDSIAYRKTITCGYINTSHTEILGGLIDGDTIVTIGQGSLKDSAKVQIISGLASAQ